MTMGQDNTGACDVLVVGGGPAGSTIATLLAEKGWQVTLLEKAYHPRFHIGESLLPMNLPILERLGVLEKVRRIGIVKHAAEFVSDRYTDRPQVFRFSKAMNNRYPYAFEVRRSEFDHVLLQNSVAAGVDVHEGVQVHDVDFHDDGSSVVHATGSDGIRCKWRTGFVVDASGRDTLISRKMGWKKRSDKHNSAAVFGHFDDVVRRSGEDEGNISIYWFKHGWFWMIPLRDGSMSVGAVCWPEYLKTRKTSLAEFLTQTTMLCPGVSERMQNARPKGDVHATGNFSYKSKHLYRKGCLLVGDSGAFIDPVFSSGVFLAMNAACLGAAAVDGALRNPAAEPALMRQYEKTVHRGLRTMSWFIYRFTSPVLHRMFMHPSNRFHMEQAVISMLSGDVFSKSPVRYSLAMFKVFYYLFMVSEWRHVLSAWRFRRRGMKQIFTQETLLKDLETPVKGK
jgi:flavin-dependent dehydrogenase